VNSTWIIALTITGASGVALIFVGVLVCILTAAGNKHYGFAAAIFACFPLAYVYCYQHQNYCHYPRRLLVWGYLLAIPTGLIAWGGYHYLGFVA